MLVALPATADAVNTTNLPLADGKTVSSPKRGYLWECNPSTTTRPCSSPFTAGCFEGTELETGPPGGG